MAGVHDDAVNRLRMEPEEAGEALRRGRDAVAGLVLDVEAAVLLAVAREVDYSRGAVGQGLPDVLEPGRDGRLKPEMLPELSQLELLAYAPYLQVGSQQKHVRGTCRQEEYRIPRGGSSARGRPGRLRRGAAHR